MAQFKLGLVVVTPGFLNAINASNQTSQEFLGRHLALEQGELCDNDHQLNKDSLMDGSRILSSFRLSTGVKIWVITEAADDNNVRNSTCLLLPEEY